MMADEHTQSSRGAVPALPLLMQQIRIQILTQEIKGPPAIPILLLSPLPLYLPAEEPRGSASEFSKVSAQVQLLHNTTI
jgi:hypothetical protein